MGNFLTKIGTSFTKATSRTGFFIKKKSPEILFAEGVVIFIGTVVLACRATLKADEVLDHHREKMRDIEDAKDIADHNAEAAMEYDDELYLQDRRNQTIKTAVELTKLYVPVIAMGALSITCFMVSRNIMHKRYLGVVAAYNAVNEAFNTYRKRVRDEYGEQLDRHFRYGTTYDTMKEEIVDENGKKKKQDVEVSNTSTDMALPSDNAVFFDESNPNWDPNPNFSLMFLRAKQNYWNDQLQIRGHVFLNEVLLDMGFEHTTVGSVVGWMKGEGDNFIDFGLYDQNKENVRNFVNGKDNVVLLEFNHNGVIFDKI